MKISEGANNLLQHGLLADGLAALSAVNEEHGGKIQVATAVVAGVAAGVSAGVAAGSVTVGIAAGATAAISVPFSLAITAGSGLVLIASTPFWGPALLIGLLGVGIAGLGLSYYMSSPSPGTEIARMYDIQQTTTTHISYFNVKTIRTLVVDVNPEKKLNYYMDAAFISAASAEYPSTWNEQTGKMLEAYYTNRSDFLDRYNKGEFDKKKK